MQFSVYVLVTVLVVSSACRSRAKSSTALSEAVPAQVNAGSACTDYESAVTKIATLTGMSADSDLDQALAKYCSLSIPSEVEPKFGRLLLDDLMAQKWGGEITDFVATADLLFQDNEPKFKQENDAAFRAAKDILEKLRQSINRLVGKYNPGFVLLDAAELRGKHQGKGIVVAVFDVFEDEQLSKQRDFYKGAQIEPLARFGNPVGLNHGNIVVDVLLAIAPRLTIVPVSATAAKYNEGMRFIVGRGDVAIVNMSRAFLGTEKDSAVDPEFATLIDQMSREKIVIKALGNTGADLSGALNSRRQAAGLGPVGDLTTYDSSLIKSYLERVTNQSMAAPYLIFAENMTVFADQISLTATVPGGNEAAQRRTIGAPADGVFSWSTDNFEAGSSFAAPQLSAISALLVEACTKVRAAARQQCLDSVITAMKRSAQRPAGTGAGLSPAEVGLGVVHGDNASQVVSAGI